VLWSEVLEARIESLLPRGQVLAGVVLGSASVVDLRVILDESEGTGHPAYVVSTIELEARFMLAWFVFVARAEATGRRQHAK
jgi:hypothetical protein